jgi:hypothetical protein
MAFYRGPNVVTNGLVLNLDAANIKSYPGSGTVWRDLSGNGNNMSLVNTPTYATTYNGGFIFNGSTQYANIAGTENQITSSAVTVEVVCSVTSNTFTSVGGNPDGQFIAYRQNTRTGNYEGYEVVYVTGNGTSFGKIISVATSATATVSIVSGSSNYSLNTPIVICATYDSSFIRLYINGSFISQTATGFALNYNTNHKLTLGRANPTGTTYDGYFNGRIYSYKQYNRVLSDAEILQNYNALKPRFNLT